MKGIYELEMAQEPSGNNIMIVDALNLAFRYKHAGKEVFAQDYYNMVKSLAKSYSAGNIILACDWGKSKFRKELYPEYKADREVKVAEQTAEEKEAFEKFFLEFENTIEFCKHYFTVLKYQGVEADDIAAYLSHYYYKETSEHIWLISSDKDWDLLITPNTSRFSYVTRKEYKYDNWHEYYDYPLSMALDIKALVGGKDNIVGVSGIGEKRAHTLLKTYDSVFDIVDNLPLPGKAKYIQNLNQFGEESLLRNLTLIDKITYCIDAIGLENVKDIKEKLK